MTDSQQRFEAFIHSLGVNTEMSANAAHTYMRDEVETAWLAWQEAEKPRWISVKERMPEPAVLILVWVPDKKEHDIVYFSPSASGYWTNFERDYDLDQISHWMPLPELPTC